MQACPASSNLAARCKASSLHALELGSPRWPSLMINLPRRPGPARASEFGEVGVGWGVALGHRTPPSGRASRANGSARAEQWGRPGNGSPTPASSAAPAARRAPAHRGPPRPRLRARPARGSLPPCAAARARRRLSRPGRPSFLGLRHPGAACGDSRFLCGRLPVISFIDFFNFPFIFGSGLDVSLPP